MSIQLNINIDIPSISKYNKGINSTKDLYLNMRITHKDKERLRNICYELDTTMSTFVKYVVNEVIEELDNYGIR